ncbi:MgtC/SapB family protein [Aggregicoccus sp. 17bor-14]|uniref:MgtC/SapB family protein n=1 Tax=Myxococcaceae TaxID=31 RepID=UPI00129C83BF|nr:MULTISPECIES: MgtC/SapB family protein [Myxococcaceae]MBF5042019.1 MgtC/SapB family protein [Simulacricoccus sp. 17bor-14]MRI87799.1 MgtC/SapB family protein [Aggregicoccus sp. 17bor-14]
MGVTLESVDILLRLALAALLGLVLGLERELRGQAAGLRTHILVSLGSCLFTLASIYVVLPLTATETLSQEGVRGDVTRIASQVVVGIGFLGGGAILRTGSRVKGLTTAANLWLTASLGLACGIGFYLGAGVTAVLALAALSGLRPVERAIRERRKRLKAKSAQPEEPEEREADEA